jgi:hypothetical protein
METATTRHHARITRALRGTVLVAAAALLAALAGPAPGASAASNKQTSAAHLVARAFATSEAANSVVVNGTFVNGKEVVHIHVTDAKGGSGFGSVKVGGLTIHIVQVDGSNYFKAGKDYWGKVLGSKNALPVGLYANHWVKASSSQTDSPGVVFSAFVNMSTLLAGFNTKGVAWHVSGHPTFHGTRVVAVRGVQRGMTGTLLIAAKGPPYLMAIEPPHGQGGVTFSHWNKPLTVRPPGRWLPFTPSATPSGGSPTGGASSSTSSGSSSP